MSEYLESTIKSVDLCKGEIVISGIDGGKDFCCKKPFYENLKNDQIFLVENNTKVKFNSKNKNGILYANNLEIVSVISTVKEINLEQKRIIINRLNEEQDKDFLCTQQFYERTLSDKQLANLKKGDKVLFKPVYNDGKYFAQNISAIDEHHEKLEGGLNISTKQVNTKDLSNALYEELSNKINFINRGSELEDFTLFVLRLLGVSELYAIPRNDAAGKPDGMFKVYNASTNTPRLEVIYDCTLNPEWEQKKEVQIKNYINQICGETMQIEYIYKSDDVEKNIKEKVLLSSNADKQIWIITKNNSRTISKEQINMKENEISISLKEISISDLISLTRQKYLDPTYTRMDELADKLKNLGSN